MTLSERDQKYNWHPHANIKQPNPVAIAGRRFTLGRKRKGIHWLYCLGGKPLGYKFIANAIIHNWQRWNTSFGDLHWWTSCFAIRKVNGDFPKSREKLFLPDQLRWPSAKQFFLNKGIVKDSRFLKTLSWRYFGAMAASGISFSSKL
jgi:adenosylmethionine-8-amino-7-oxononanoate aminotransferase